MPDFDRPSAAMPLDVIENIQQHLDDGQMSRAVVSSKVTHLEDTVGKLGLQVKNLDDGQLEILRIQKEQSAALARNTEVTEQIRDLWKGGNFLQKTLIWVGAACGGVYGIVELVRQVRGH